MPKKTPAQLEIHRRANKRWEENHPDARKNYREAHKEAINARNAARYAEKREEILAKQRIYNAAHRQEKAETARTYRLANAEELRIKKQLKYQKDREDILAKQHAKYLENPQKKLQINQKWAETHPDAVQKIKARYRESHRDELQEQGRIYSAKRYAENPEKARELAKAYAESHRDIVNAKARQRHAEHPEYAREWRQTHPKNLRASQKKRRAIKKGAPITDFTAAQWEVMQEHYQHRCVYCGKRHKGHLSQDHITPLSKGGNHTASNIVPACRNCNSKKHTGNVLVPVQPLLLLPTKDRS